jgi:spore coat polysaccharide biosynthesis protein SpsF
MSSTRLPGKSLADIGGEPSLVLLLRRLGRAAEVGRVVVATSTGVDDDPVAEAAEVAGAGVHRGPLEDVLGRFAGAARGHKGPVVRITADCPLVDPGLVDAVVRLLPGADYACNVEPRGFPKGLDVEVLTAEALARLDAEATDPSDREHVTLLARRSPDRYRRANLAGSEELAGLRWTVDHPEDLEFVRLVVERLGERRYEAEMVEVLAAVRAEPSLADFNGRRG